MATESQLDCLLYQPERATVETFQQERLVQTYNELVEERDRLVEAAKSDDESEESRKAYEDMARITSGQLADMRWTLQLLGFGVKLDRKTKKIIDIHH